MIELFLFLDDLDTIYYTNNYIIFSKGDNYEYIYELRNELGLKRDFTIYIEYVSKLKQIINYV